MTDAYLVDLADAIHGARESVKTKAAVAGIETATVAIGDNSSVAAEVCEGDGAVQSVTLAGSTYRVRCASGIVQTVERKTER